MAEKYWWGSADTVYAGDYTWDSSKTQQTLDNAAAVDKGGGLVGIPITGHPYLAADTLTLADTTNYDGDHELVSVTVDEVVITTTYQAETFAGTETATSAVVSNWRAETDDSDAAMPVDGDILSFDSRASLESETGKRQSCNVNVDGASTGTPNLNRAYIKSTYDGDIGSADEYLELQASGDDIIMEGSGTLYLKLSAGAGVDAACGRFVINNGSGKAYLASLENDGANVGLFAEVVGLGGKLYLDDDCGLTSLVAAGAMVKGGTGVGNNKGSTVVVITQVAGKVQWDSPIADGSIFVGGEFWWGTELASPVTGLDCGAIKIFGGMRFVWRCMDVDASIMKQFVNYGGLLDAGQAVNAGYDKQIGTGAGEISESFGGKLLLAAQSGSVVLGTGSKIRTYGAVQMTPPARAEVEW